MAHTPYGYADAPRVDEAPAAAVQGKAPAARPSAKGTAKRPAKTKL